MESIWFRSCPIEHKEALAQNIKADIAVIGAGMTGILTAYKLQKTGKSVVVLEANRIANGQTGKTTAKITSQHGLLYYRMILDLGEEKARQYAQANEKAIEAYRSLIQEEKIDCDFETVDAYVYSQNAEILEKEALSAQKLGISASFCPNSPLSRCHSRRRQISKPGAVPSAQTDRASCSKTDDIRKHRCPIR